MSYTSQPKVVGWFKGYCGLLAVMYFLLLLLGVAFFVIPPHELEMAEDEAYLSGGIMILMALPFLLASLLPLFVRPQPWVWLYGIVVICLGMTSCCTLPAAIPLLIFWIKPEARAFYGRD